ncbi:MAG: SDR family NAD(P)-dependent oxidoreductase, partial [Planctomycetota bacterium]
MSRIALITGTTGGLGGEIASRLAAAGYGIATLNRSREKAEAQAEALRRAHPGQDVYPFVADLADTADVARVIDEIASACPRLDAIYNVSGVLTDRRVVGPQGLESHFAVNTLAPYLLIRGLRPSLAAAASAGGPAVVVNFSSEVVTGVKAFDVASLPDPPEIGGLFGAYAKTKLAVNA